MTKRLHSKTYDDYETLLRDAAVALVDGVANRVRSTPSWICMQQAIERVWKTYAEAELERRMLVAAACSHPSAKFKSLPGAILGAISARVAPWLARS